MYSYRPLFFALSRQEHLIIEYSSYLSAAQRRLLGQCIGMLECIRRFVYEGRLVQQRTSIRVPRTPHERRRDAQLSVSNRHTQPWSAHFPDCSCKETSCYSSFFDTMASTSRTLYTLTPALTTTFTPPPQCVHPRTFTRDVDVLIDDAAPQVIVRPAYPSCFPSGFWAATESFTNSDHSTFVHAPFFSPAPACPAGYTAVSGQADSGSETSSARCCPS